MPAPPPPTPEEWKLAATYTLRNSKRYRYNWGQQVRSMMGTAGEGPDQGQVRFRIEIAPDGKIARIETLWTTSQVAEKLALNAIQSMPPLPPTPTGKPLVFEQTISFEPFESGWPPSYKLDCLSEPLPFHNPYMWDGASPQQPSPEYRGRAHRPPPPVDCVFDSTSDSIEQEDADMKRQMDQWRWGR
ncbi:MAG: energy transducer TonB [Thiobacillaceae bacterium]